MQAMHIRRDELPGYTPRLNSDSRVMVLLHPLQSAQLNQDNLAALMINAKLYAKLPPITILCNQRPDFIATTACSWVAWPFSFAAQQQCEGVGPHSAVGQAKAENAGLGRRQQYEQCVLDQTNIGCKQACSNAAYQRLHRNGTVLVGWRVKAFQTCQTGT